MENNNWGAPQQQGAQWPAAAGFQPALGSYAPTAPILPRRRAPTPCSWRRRRKAMLAAAPAQQPAPPPPPLPRAAPAISTWLDEVKPAGEKYASIFGTSASTTRDVQNLRDDLAAGPTGRARNAGAKRGHLNNIESAVIAKRANAAPRHLAPCRRRRPSRRRRAPCPRLPPPPAVPCRPPAAATSGGPAASALLTAWLDEVQCQGPVRERVLAIANDVPELLRRRSRP